MYLELLVSGILVGGIYALAAVGLSMVMGVLRLVNVSHGLFLTLGAYWTYTLTSIAGLNFFLSLAIAGGITLATGCLIERFVLRRARKDELGMVILTLALAFLGEELIRIIWGPVNKQVPAFLSGAWYWGGVTIDQQRLVTFLLSMVLIAALYYFVKSSRTGRAVRLVAQDTEAAQLVGIDKDRIYMMVYGWGAGLAALAGGMLSAQTVTSPAMGWDPLMRSFAIVILGGMGSFAGTAIGGLLLGVIELFTGYFINPRLSSLASFLVMVLVIVVKPSGLFGSRYNR